MRVYPYPVLAGAITLDVTTVALDGAALVVGTVIEGDHVALHRAGRDDWEEARIGVRVRVPDSELSQGAWSDVTVLATLRDRATRVRSTVPLRAAQEGVWSGAVVVYRDLHHDQIDLAATVTATVDGVPGRMIGTTERPRSIGLRPRTSTQGHHMPIEWEDFAEHPDLERHRKIPWVVECTGERPVIRLNRGFEGLERALRSGDPAVRTSLAARIAADAWGTTAHAALQAVHTGQERPALPEGWRGSVLRCLLPLMFPEMTADDALAEIASRSANGDDGDLRTRVAHAAAEQAGVARALGGFLRTLDRRET